MPQGPEITLMPRSSCVSERRDMSCRAIDVSTKGRSLSALLACKVSLQIISFGLAAGGAALRRVRCVQAGALAGLARFGHLYGLLRCELVHEQRGRGARRQCGDVGGANVDRRDRCG